MKLLFNEHCYINTVESSYKEHIIRGSFAYCDHKIYTVKSFVNLSIFPMNYMIPFVANAVFIC